MKTLFKVLLLLFFVLSSGTSFAGKVELAHIFSDNMVLQRNKPIKFWGTSIDSRTFKITFNNVEKKIKPQKTGRWEVVFPAMDAGGPYQLTIESDTLFTLNNILMGDVWICSGQSNMEWSMRKVFNSPYELANANNENIRFFSVPRKISEFPIDDFSESKWQYATFENLVNVSAVAYFFAKNIYESEQIPQGIICSYWGGSSVEAWTSLESIGSHPDYTEKINEFKSKAGTTESFTYLQEQSNKEMAEWNKLITSKDEGYIQRWYLPEYNDQDWKTMNVPGYWEYYGLPNFDGIVWLRKDIDIPSSMQGKGLILNMEVLKNYEITWFNGVEIGRVSWDKGRRIYYIPADLVRKGKNTIVLRIENKSGLGGFETRDESNIFLRELIGEQVLSIPLAGEWKYKPTLNKSEYPAQPQSKVNIHVPSCLYNGMIAPITNLSIKGVIWYQGETNAWRAYQYRSLFPLMINDWRKQFAQGDFPFLYVQLAGYTDLVKEPQDNTWAELREAQTMTLNLPNTGMAVAIDLGNPYDVHPTNKQEVGRRLAVEAQKLVYGKTYLKTSPLYQRMETDGNKIIIHFSNAENGLISTDEKIGGFAIADRSKKFVWANVKIENDKVIIWNDDIKEPVAVRYAWTGSPVESNGANLYNAENFPVSPFRTDDWTPISIGNK